MIGIQHGPLADGIIAYRGSGGIYGAGWRGELAVEMKDVLQVGHVALEQEIPGVLLWDHAVGGNPVEVVNRVGVLELQGEPIQDPVQVFLGFSVQVQGSFRRR